MLSVECFKQPSLSCRSSKVDKLSLCTISAISCSSDDIGALPVFHRVSNKRSFGIFLGMPSDPRRKLRFRKLALGSHSNYDASKREFLRCMHLEKSHCLLFWMYSLFWREKKIKNLQKILWNYRRNRNNLRKLSLPSMTRLSGHGKFVSLSVFSVFIHNIPLSK